MTAKAGDAQIRLNELLSMARASYGKPDFADLKEKRVESISVSHRKTFWNDGKEHLVSLKKSLKTHKKSIVLNRVFENQKRCFRCFRFAEAESWKPKKNEASELIPVRGLSLS